MGLISIAVLVSGNGTNLQALIHAAQQNVLQSGRLMLVISSKENAYALTRAKNAGIPAVCIERRLYATSADFEASILELLLAHDIDMLVLAGFMHILSRDFVARYPKRILNVHPSLIPSFCGKGFYGLRVHQEALAYGVKVTGATVHYVNEVTDEGQILFQKAVDVKEGDTPERLQQRVMEQAEWVLLPQAVEWVAQNLQEEA